tara:strand:+ start:2040 stop:2156 length:117 start_codon:yes stop_codon:yes gene_type:complete
MHTAVSKYGRKLGFFMFDLTDKKEWKEQGKQRQMHRKL